MKRIARALIAVAALSVFAVPALAQDRRADDPEQTYTFDDDDVLGTRVLSEGERLIVRPRAARTTLIRTRAEYLHELLVSVETL